MSLIRNALAEADMLIKDARGLYGDGTWQRDDLQEARRLIWGVLGYDLDDEEEE